MNRVAWMTIVTSMSMQFAAITFVGAQDLQGDPTETKVRSGPHGGSLRQVGQVSVETVVSRKGIQVFLFDRSGQNVAVNQGRGVASVRVDGDAKRYRYDLVPDEKGGLTAMLDLSKSEGRQLQIDLQLVGISVARGKGLTFREVVSVPASEQQLASAAIARQKVCPVSGKPLGSMGRPVPVNANGKRVYVCSADCVNTVEADPEKYVHARTTVETAAISTMGEQVRDGVFKVTVDDQPYIAAQKRCPVMDEPLDAMGGPYRVNANGRAIYICCPGCAKKIAADPDKYLAILKQQNVETPLLR